MEVVLRDVRTSAFDFFCERVSMLPIGHLYIESVSHEEEGVGCSSCW